MPSGQTADFEILKAIRRIIRRTSQHSRTVGKHNGITVPQMLCLRAIHSQPAETEVTVAGVAKSVQLSAATVSRILDRLENAGWIVRERRSKDRRRVCLSLTDEGRATLQRLPRPLSEEFLQRLAALPEEERQSLLSALQRIVQLMDATELDAAPVLTPELEVGPETKPGPPLDSNPEDSAVAQP